MSKSKKSFKEFWKDQQTFIKVFRKDLTTRKQRRDEAKRLWLQIHKKNAHYQ